MRTVYASVGKQVKSNPRKGTNRGKCHCHSRYPCTCKQGLSGGLPRCCHINLTTLLEEVTSWTNLSRVCNTSRTPLPTDICGCYVLQVETSYQVRTVKERVKPMCCIRRFRCQKWPLFLWFKQKKLKHLTTENLFICFPVKLHGNLIKVKQVSSPYFKKFSVLNPIVESITSLVTSLINLRWWTIKRS